MLTPRSTTTYSRSWLFIALAEVAVGHDPATEAGVMHLCRNVSPTA